MGRKDVEALTLKPGPTISGGVAEPVGGEILPIDKLSVFLSNYWILILFLLLPFGFLLYKKRDMVIRFLTRVDLL